MSIKNNYHNLKKLRINTPVNFYVGLLYVNVFPRSDSDSEESSVLSGDDHVTSTMVDEEEPPLPPELEDEANKSWLYQRSRTPSPVREERKNDTK